MIRIALTYALGLCIVLIGSAAPPASAAPDVVGIWQGKLMLTSPVRRVLKVGRNADGTLTATIYSIDETDDPIPVSTISLDGSTLELKMNVNQGEWRDYHRSYRGTLSADGESITGTWSAPGMAGWQMNFARATPATAWVIPPRPSVRFVTVDKDVKLEVVDWGGTGKPIVLLAGQGNTAHIFSSMGFARSFTSNHHVYGITRRGYGESSRPAATAANYRADRLADDVVEVIDALHIDRPVLVGHSIAGEELSSIGMRYPSKVSGLVYLDAGYSYALYDRRGGGIVRFPFDSADAIADLAQANGNDFAAQRGAIDRLLHDDLPLLTADLRTQKTFFAAIATPPPGAPPQPPDAIGHAIDSNGQRYTGPIAVPILAIFAAPHDWKDDFGSNAAANAAAQAAEYKDTMKQIQAFKQDLPNAKVVRIPNANHYVFLSNRDEVIRDVNAFLKSLP
jgi:non-heme chloroperoxidase